MLIILTFCLVISSVLICMVKKSKESMWLLGICITLMLEICGVMIFIAKKGGISKEVLGFLYFSTKIQSALEYFLITLDQLGFLIALGRTLFPFFFLGLAMNYSMVPLIRKNNWLMKIIAVLPCATLMIYAPPLYRFLTKKQPLLQRVIAGISLTWITTYLLLALLLLIWEYKSITMRFCRRQFGQIMVSMFALSGIYYLYYRQDPGQVYHFYGYVSVWNAGIGYLQVNPSLLSYMTLVIVSTVCCLLGFFSLLQYTKGTYDESHEDIVMKRKFDTAKVGASVFVHSMKNQLLSSRVLFKRIGQLYEQPDADMTRIREYIGALEGLNEAMLERMEELYRCVKTNSIYMVPVPMEEITSNAVERFHKKYPDVEVRVDDEVAGMVLADKTHLCEALYNLLTNAQEAVTEADRGERGEVSMICRNERLYTVIEVRDNGKGISRKQMNKIFEPFYSSKNSRMNWGMGLYYVREIVKSHLGTLRIESKEGQGSSFFILLPRYE